jgi:putative membrane protein
MLKQEWKNLFKNKILLIVTAAVIVIPTIYTTLFLGSMWDPYGNIDQLPVAVVNHDEPVVYEGQELDIGENLMDELKDNESLDFQFPSEKEAERGLKDGMYYMVITIPEDFSAHAASLTDTYPQKMILNYETNPGTNYIASKMSESAMKELESSVRKEVTKTYTEVLIDKFSEIGDGMQEAAEGSGELKNGADKLADGNRTITDNLYILSDSALVFANGSRELQEGLGEYTDGVISVASGAEELQEGVNALNSGLNAALKGGSDLAKGAVEVDDKMTELYTGLSELNAAASGLPEAADALNNGAVSLGNGAEQLTGGIASLSEGAAELKEGADALASGLQSAASYSQSLREKAAGLDMVLSELAETEALPEEIKAQIAALQQQADAFSAGIVDYTNGVDAAAAGSMQLASKIPEFQNGIFAVQNGADSIKTGIGQLQTGTATLAQQAPALTGGISSAASGAEQLQNQGTSVLRNGAADLNSGIGELASGGAMLKDGTEALAKGTGQLISNNSALNDGASKLTNGAVQISSGAEKLHDGSIELGDGIGQVSDGADTLEKELGSGADQIRKINTSDQTSDMFAAPVEAKETQITEVPDNGHAMAPYMMSVGLWVGCIAFSLMYPLTEYSGKMKSGFKWWISKASVLYLTAILQAVVMIGALHLFDGFSPVETTMTVVVACAASLAFMSIMYFFTSLLGRVGSFLMLIFMVIQLAGSVGTYPYEVSGSFVPYLHDWVPFTYTVQAFRSTISGGESIRGCLIFLMILFIVFTSLTIIEFIVRARKVRAGQNTWTVWLEEHGLA